VSKGGEAHDDPRRAETALRRARLTERCGPPLALLVGQPIQRGDGPAGDPAGRGDARDAGSAVHQDGAAPTLALRAAAILHGVAAEPIPEHFEQGSAFVGYLDLATVDSNSERHSARLG
jgi:hypothetical protein